MLAKSHTQLKGGLSVQQIFTFQGLPGFIQMRTDTQNPKEIWDLDSEDLDATKVIYPKAETDNFMMIGYPNGFGAHHKI